ncbi:hypothetical protein ES705_11142 [subsurface metagenome]
MNDIRSELAREWAKEHNIQLSLFSRQYEEEREATKREKKANKLKNEERFKEICRGIKSDQEELSEKEFNNMCKKAGVEPGSLAKTVFTESLKSS